MVRIDARARAQRRWRSPHGSRVQWPMWPSMTGKAQSLDSPLVAEPDRLTAPQPFVDRGIAAAIAFELGSPFLVGLVEAVGSCQR